MQASFDSNWDHGAAISWHTRGWRPTPKQMMTPGRRTLPGLERLVMAEQWVAPGGGAPTSIASAQDAVRILCAGNGIKFRTA